MESKCTQNFCLLTCTKLHCRDPHLKLLYLTPERIVKGTKTREILNDLYQNEMLARFVIDEAHCVSSWGHDFRKDYRELSILKESFPEAPIVALTATARKKVADDTLKVLGISNCRKFNTGTIFHHTQI
jgi:superfamily II DNA helicase RecQ